MKPTKAELIRKIDAIKGVCESSKPGIRDLVAEITGIDLTPEPPEPTYRIGQRFHYEGPTWRGDYILALFEYGKVGAVNLATGFTRRTSPPRSYPAERAIEVANPSKISRLELCEIFRVILWHTDKRVTLIS